MPSTTSFLAELQRRNVHRAAMFYAAAAWLLVQVATQVFPFFDIPNSTVRIVVIAVMIGFPFALLFSWFYEWTPQGIKLESEIDRSVSVTRQTGKTMDRWIIAVLGVAVVLLLTDKLVFNRDRRAADEVPVASVAADKSVAVLPFENLSEDKANGYFADGIQDEILTGLAKIGDLKVISRTSTQRYASRPDNLVAIARELGVAHILEGSVQRAGNRVRINVQLIEASSDSHLWAETYDRTLDDVFVVQSEVSQKIAESLAARLTRSELSALTRKPTDNAEAYAAYLKGRSFGSVSVVSRGQVDLALAAYRRAVALDPGFALAWGELARLTFLSDWSGLDASGALREEGRQALEKAMALAPGLPQVEMARAVYLYYIARDFSAAYAVIGPLQSRLPNDIDVWAYSGFLARRLGFWEEAKADLMRARVLAPNDSGIAFHLGSIFGSMGDFTQAVALFDAGLALKPDDDSLLPAAILGRWLLGDLAGAAKVLAQSRATSAMLQALRGQQALLQRDFEAAVRTLQAAIDSGSDIHTDTVFDGYIPARIDWQLQLALAQQRAGAQADARASYSRLAALAHQALEDKPENPYVEAAWGLVLGQALAGLGEREAAVSAGETAVALTPESADALEAAVWNYYLARIHALNGDAARAVPLATRLLHTKASYLTTAWLGLDPAWDALRSDARFKALIAEHPP
jgi:TolB-like protein/Flp pilus assembly protein TadD